MTKNKSKQRCLDCRTLTEAKAKNFCGSTPSNTQCYYVPLKVLNIKQSWSWHN